MQQRSFSTFREKNINAAVQEFTEGDFSVSVKLEVHTMFDLAPEMSTAQTTCFWDLEYRSSGKILGQIQIIIIYISENIIVVHLTSPTKTFCSIVSYSWTLMQLWARFV